MGELCVMDGVQGLSLLTTPPGNLEAGLLSKHFFKTLLSPATKFKSMPHTYWTFVCNLFNFAQPHSFRVLLESSNDQDHTDRTGECRFTDAFGGAIGSDSKETRFKCLRASHGVVQAASHSQIACQ
jgi:hypothetical protein